MNKITLLLFTIIFYQGHSQATNKISVAVFQENIHYEYKSLNQFNPGGEIGLTWKTKEKKFITKEFNTYLGGYYHRKVQTAIYLRAEYLYRFRYLRPLSFDLFGGLGYMHTFYPGNLYEQNDNGDFEDINQLGRPHAIGNIGIGVSIANSSRWEPFAKFEWMLQTPFANGIPVVPHSFLKTGINFKLEKNEEVRN